MSRDDIVCDLAAQIVSGCQPGRIALATVLDSVLDEPLVSNDDAAVLLFGNDEAKLQARERCEDAARAVVMSWLEGSPRGTALVDREVERRREEETEDAL